MAKVPKNYDDDDCVNIYLQFMRLAYQLHTIYVHTLSVSCL